MHSRFLRFFLLACLISWTIWTPLWLPKLGYNGCPILPFNHGLGGIGPLMAATIMHLRNGKSLKDIAVLFFRVQKLGTLLLALCSPYLLLIISLIIRHQSLAFDWQAIGTTSEFPHFTFLTYGIYNLVCFGLGEEAGWCGYGVPLLERRYGFLKAAILFTAFWAIWHLPLFLYRPTYITMPAAGILGWIFSLLTGRILLNWLFRISGTSVLVAAVFHSTVDMAFINSGTDAETVNLLDMLITFWGMGVVVFHLVFRKSKKRG